MSALIITPVAADVVLPLRQSILHPEKALGFSIYAADNDLTTLHLGAYSQQELVGVASIYLESTRQLCETNAWRLRDMGVVKSMRRKQVGSALLEACFAHISAKKGTLFWCYARSSAVPFYLARAFQLVNKPVNLRGFGFRFLMWRTMGNDPGI